MAIASLHYGAKLYSYVMVATEYIVHVLNVLIFATVYTSSSGAARLTTEPWLPMLSSSVQDRISSAPAKAGVWRLDERG